MNANKQFGTVLCSWLEIVVNLQGNYVHLRRCKFVPLSDLSQDIKLTLYSFLLNIKLQETTKTGVPHLFL